MSQYAVHTLTDTQVVPSEIFSPESGGRVKARSAMDEMRTHGMMRLKNKTKITLNQCLKDGDIHRERCGG